MAVIDTQALTLKNIADSIYDAVQARINARMTCTWAQMQRLKACADNAHLSRTFSVIIALLEPVITSQDSRERLDAVRAVTMLQTLEATTDRDDLRAAYHEAICMMVRN